MKTIEQIYGPEKAKAISDAMTNGHLRVTVAKVTIAAEKAKSTADVEIEYPRVDILDRVGSLVLYGSEEKALADETYAWDLGVRSKIRQGFLATVVDPDKDLRKMAALGVKAGLYADEETALAALRALRNS
jgi:hypothetical protein